MVMRLHSSMYERVQSSMSTAHHMRDVMECMLVCVGVECVCVGGVQQFQFSTCIEPMVRHPTGVRDMHSLQLGSCCLGVAALQRLVLPDTVGLMVISECIQSCLLNDEHFYLTG